MAKGAAKTIFTNIAVRSGIKETVWGFKKDFEALTTQMFFKDRH